MQQMSSPQRDLSVDAVTPLGHSPGGVAGCPGPLSTNSAQSEAGALLGIGVGNLLVLTDPVDVRGARPRRLARMSILTATASRRIAATLTTITRASI
jgi:hypothetical protein